MNKQAGKGDKRRPLGIKHSSSQAYRDGWDRVFGKKKKT